MKNSSGNKSSRPIGASLLAGALFVGSAFVGVSLASDYGDGMHCLAAFDLLCAERARDQAIADDPGDKDVVGFDALVRFHDGDFPGALEAYNHYVALGGHLDDPPPIQATAEATRDFESHDVGDLFVRLSPGPDEVVVDDAFETMTLMRQRIDPLLGGGPDHPIRVDIFPTAKQFIAASGLPPEAVQTTGVIALSKWNRLMVTSPRALAHGYAWRDTIAHEYIHLAVAFRTADNTPVWLQEGLAKYLEVRWRGDGRSYLSADQQAQLAKAVHTGEFVPFEKFKHSMAYLDSGEEASLAFAQVSTMVGFLVDQHGDGVLRRVLDRIRNDEDAMEAVAEENGDSDFDAFTAKWKVWVATLPLVEARLQALPRVLDGEGADFADDPLLAMREDLVRYVRVGDLLLDAGHPKAALVEYAKAESPDDVISPVLYVRKAKALAAAADVQRALAVLDEALKLYPEYAPLLVQDAKLLTQQERIPEALHAWREACDLDPTDPEIQRALASLYEKSGDATAAAQHAKDLRLLSTGGVDTPSSP